MENRLDPANKRTKTSPAVRLQEGYESQEKERNDSQPTSCKKDTNKDKESYGKDTFLLEKDRKVLEKEENGATWLYESIVYRRQK